MASLGVTTRAAPRAWRGMAGAKWRTRTRSCKSAWRTVERSWMVSTTGPPNGGATLFVS